MLHRLRVLLKARPVSLQMMTKGIKERMRNSARKSASKEAKARLIFNVIARVLGSVDQMTPTFLHGYSSRHLKETHAAYWWEESLKQHIY